MPDKYREDVTKLGADEQTANRMVAVTTEAVERIQRQNEQAHRRRTQARTVALAVACLLLAVGLWSALHKLDSSLARQDRQQRELLVLARQGNQLLSILEAQQQTIGADDTQLKQIGNELATEEQRAATNSAASLAYVLSLDRTLNAICRSTRCGAPPISVPPQPPPNHGTAQASPPTTSRSPPPSTTTTSTTSTTTTTTTILPCLPTNGHGICAPGRH